MSVTEQVLIRLTPNQKERLRRKAIEANTSVSNFIVRELELGDDGYLPRNRNLQNAILEVLGSNELGISDIALILGTSYGNCSNALSRLINKKLVEKVSPGKYRVANREVSQNE